ncbi:MAG: hypothetical protein L0H15_09820, partial [Nitrosospira sp.]|nr:hypothetical protein [Nitrosospira sp.]
MQHGEPQYPLRSRLTAGDVHAAVDRVVAAHGAYIPVELLLDTGLLRFVDYEAWRRGQHVGLDSLLADDLDRVIPLLREAARWAGELGFQPETRDYFGWGDHANQRLALFGADPGDADGLLATHYVRRDAPASGNQLDLFFDGRATVALGDLRAALRARDVEGARRGLTVVAEQTPHHDLLPFAQRLIDALRDLPNPVSARQAPAELTTIERRLAPAAQALLGPSARDLMAAFWQRLAVALADAPFDPRQPTLHASYAHVQCLDWRGAIAAIERVPGHTDHPALLARMAPARYHDGDYHAAITAWIRLCWRSQPAATTALDELPATATKLRRLWAEFRNLDLDPAPEAPVFPAYL